MPRSSGQKVRSFLMEACFVSIATVWVAELSGANTRTGLYTPDSEFYAALGAFGDAITDRAPTPAYYWTRLGLIAPSQLLNRFLDPHQSWAMYRMFLIGLIISAVYFVARRTNFGRITSALVASAITANSVVMYFVGDPYVTGSVIAWMFVVVAIVCGAKSDFLFAPIGSFWIGTTFGVLLFLNPTGLIICLVMTTAVGLTRMRSERLKIWLLLRLVPSAIFGVFASTGVLLLANQWLFPNLNWLSTTEFYARILRGSSYASSSRWEWLRTETSLIVPLVVLVSLVVANQLRRGGRPNWLPTILLVSSIVYPLVVTLRAPSPVLEASFYSAMMWPGVLCALLIGSATLVDEEATTLDFGSLVLLGSLLGILIGLGHLRFVIPISGVAVLATAVLIAGLIGYRLSKIKGLRDFCVAFLVALCVLQVFQNGRPDWGGVIRRIPYADAFRPSSADAVIRQNTEAQEWLLSQTRTEDKVLVYAEGGTILTSPAAFQLWGPNAIDSSPAVTEFARSNLITVKPGVIATYFSVGRQRRLAREEYMADLVGGQANTDTPQCREFQARNNVPPLEVCLYRFSW